MDHVWEGERQVAYIKNGIAFDMHGRERYKVDGDKLVDPTTGVVVGYLG
jgi:hypothetical protein